MVVFRKDCFSVCFRPSLFVYELKSGSQSKINNSGVASAAKSNNTQNIRRLVDESFVPVWTSKQAFYIVDCRIFNADAIAALFCFILGLGPKGPSHIPSIRSNPQVAPNDRINYL